PLSRAPEIVGLLARRIEDASRREGVRLDETSALVMVGRGSYHPCATSDMRLLSEVVARRVGANPDNASVGFYAMAEPKLPAILDEAASRPGVATVVVQPHLLFQGRLFDAIKRQVAEAQQRHRSVRFVVGEYLGPDQAVADALLRRVGQAVGFAAAAK
ncbi:MAG: CbiX/SirB N-terminal domain-containing protein, partial [Planctomycetota bacterium]